MAEGNGRQCVDECDAQQLGNGDFLVERMGSCGVWSMGNGWNAALSNEGVTVVHEGLGSDRQFAACGRSVGLLKGGDEGVLADRKSVV